MPSSRIVSTCLAVAVLYVAFIAGILRFGIDRLAIPASASAYVTPDALTRVAGSSGNEVLIRRYGKPDLGCVVFFPGQHGNAPRYDLRLFRTFTAEGIAVFALPTVARAWPRSLDSLVARSSLWSRNANRKGPSSMAAHSERCSQRTHRATCPLPG
jgi:hypothetical protein